MSQTTQKFGEHMKKQANKSKSFRIQKPYISIIKLKCVKRDIFQFQVKYIISNK